LALPSTWLRNEYSASFPRDFWDLWQRRVSTWAADFLCNPEFAPGLGARLRSQLGGTPTPVTATVVGAWTPDAATLRFWGTAESAAKRAPIWDDAPRRAEVVSLFARAWLTSHSRTGGLAAAMSLARRATWRAGSFSGL
jgi:hypothetical protein